MKKTWLVAMGILILLITSCTVENSGKTSVAHTKLNNEDIIQLIEQNFVPSESQNVYEPVSDGKGFPLEIINQLGKAVYEGNADAAVAGLHEVSLRMTERELFDIDVVTDSRDVVMRHWNYEKGEYYPYYKCDIDGDGVDELIGIEDEYPGSVYLYTDSEEGFELYGTYYAGDIRSYALFPYDNKFYLAVSCNNTGIPGESDVRLYQMDVDNFKRDQFHKHTCIRNQQEVSNHTLLYKNQEFSAIDELQAYVDEIIFDLSVVGRSFNTFFGDETRQEDLQSAWEESGREFGAVYSIDVDNDGTEDYFDRYLVWSGSEAGYDELTTELEWFTEDMKDQPCPLTEWEEDSYVRKKAWFKIFDGKTVVFSLYRKNAVPDHYVIDARIQENGTTTILYDSVFEIIKSGIKQELSEQMPYSSNTVYLPMEITYEDRDAQKAFSENLEEQANDLIQRIQGGFYLQNQGAEDIPEPLTDLLKTIGRQGKMEYEIEPDSYSRKMREYEFAALYDDANPGIFYSGADEYIYEYKSDHKKYYITATGDRGLTDLNVTVYVEDGGKLAVYEEFPSVDIFTALQYEDELYLLESHFGGESDIYIHRLLPDKVKEFGTADISIAGYGWEQIYGNGNPSEKVVTEYVDSIRDTLLNFRAGTYTGDETAGFDVVKQQRLKSLAEKLVSEEPVFSEVDFNNDGVPEYFSKVYEGEWTFYSDVYQLKEGKAAVMDYTMNNYRVAGRDDLHYALKQLWFKELEGRIYTFRLLSRRDFYILNASLVRDADITQEVTYVIGPKRETRAVLGRDQTRPGKTDS